MNGTIQHIIDDIRSKKRELDEQLKAEKGKVAACEEELTTLKSQLKASQQEIERLNQVVSGMQTQLESAKNQVVGQDNSGDRNVRIDELVREIEYCIGQLKNNA